MSTFLLTGSQTVGPFFSPALLREGARRNVLTRPETAGERIRIEGRVLDGDGVPVPDAMVEIWQANAHGRYNHPADQGPAELDSSFLGFGRSGTEEDGSYAYLCHRVCSRFAQSPRDAPVLRRRAYQRRRSGTATCPRSPAGDAAGQA